MTSENKEIGDLNDSVKQFGNEDFISLKQSHKLDDNDSGLENKETKKVKLEAHGKKSQLNENSSEEDIKLILDNSKKNSDTPVEDKQREKIKEFQRKKTIVGINESDVGITKFVSNDINPFTGILKERYSDFLVNEIDTNDKVVHLVDEGFPIEDRKAKKAAERKKLLEEKNNDGTAAGASTLSKNNPKVSEISEEDKEEVINLIGSENLEKINNLLTVGQSFETETHYDDKSERSTIHQTLRRVFNGKLETATTSNNTFKISLANSNSRGRVNRAKPIVNDYGLGPQKAYLHFSIFKENKETMEVAALLSKFLRIPSKAIRYAGTKDRRGVTVQRASINKIRVDRVNGLNRILKGIRLGSFSYSDNSLNLGDLNGNEFIITIRDARLIDSGKDDKDIYKVIESSMSTLKNKGFINYYGMQRFGTFSISTHEVGVKLLLGDWEGVCELILSEQDLVLPESVEARRVWSESRDPQLAFRKMPKKCVAESMILKTLSLNGLRSDDGNFTSDSYFKAIMKIPRNLRIMYGHAYQSFVWNNVASKRIELFGFEIVPGDLVIASNSDDKDIDKKIDFEEDVRPEQFIRARAVTQEEIEKGEKTIYDVVLPTPGFDIVYPENEKLKQVYVDVMAKDGLDPFNMSRNVREFSFAGSYRHLITKPKDLEYFIRKYENPIEQLLLTDLEILRLKQNNSDKQVESIQILPQKSDENNSPIGSRVAVILKMKLGVSSYATMALRELMKTERNDLKDVHD
ncbi:pseudouridine synthase PUS7 [Ascoidea rubescens DSM 1968]|uniref:tRNA pseudouridine synthase D n=1 Tax=Ascoidea rubescens DSM 1968 TaxID=1344418 RepID=A0A1D2VGS2_9ASCO|nr:tRNA pseudouridine synthase D [Ascoidea rubescens DSM 1968]ODV60677.1 tRNA pseudouridine synthase D [Ascoidea rubescens DSM 1968]